MRTPVISQTAFNGLCAAMGAYEADDHTDDSNQRVREITAAEAWLRRVLRAEAPPVLPLNVPTEAAINDLSNLRGAVHRVVCEGVAIRSRLVNGQPLPDHHVRYYLRALDDLTDLAIAVLNIPAQPQEPPT